MTDPCPADGAAPRNGYHHGDLRNTLIRVAVELAVAGGPKAVVLREVARRAEVSAAAVYRHFPDREALLAEVKQHAREALGESVIERLGRVPGDGEPGELTVARLRAVGEAYLDFAAAHQGLFATAFCHTGQAGTGDNGNSPEDVLKIPALMKLAEILDDLVRHGLMDPARRRGAQIAAWSTVHGLTALMDGPLVTIAPAAQAAIRQRTLDAVVAGLTADRTARPG